MMTKAVTIDNCTWEFDGLSEDLVASGLTAFQLTVASKSEDAAETIKEIERVHAVIAHDPEKLMLIESVADLRAAAASGRTGVILHFQNARPLGDDLRKVGTFRRLGVRVIQITYNERNYVGDGCLEPTNGGLSTFGRALIGELNRQHILIDLTHVGERSSLEAADLSADPCVFSHSNPKRRADNPRNITDEQMRACAERGGVIGVCGWGPISWDGGPRPPDLSTIADHLDYVADLVGPEHVGIATDAPASGKMDRILAHFKEINEAYPNVTGAFVEAFGSDIKHRYPLPLRSIPALAVTLQERGWPTGHIDGALGENMARVYEQVWGQENVA
jgi:membrane dipeptidase